MSEVSNYQKLVSKFNHLLILIKNDQALGSVIELCEGQLGGALGLTSDKIVGQNPLHVFANDLMKQHLLAAFNGKGMQFEFRHRNRNLLCNLEPYIVEDSVTDVVALVQDITERKKMERRLMLLAQTLTSLNESVSIADSDDKIVYVNPAFTRLYQYTLEEVFGKESKILRAVIHKNPDNLTQEIIAGTMSGGWEGEVYNRRKDGSEFLIYLHTSMVRDFNGEIIGFVGVSRLKEEIG